MTHPIYTSSSVILTSSTGIHGPQIAEWAIMNMLVARHHYNQTYEWQKAHHWGSSATISKSGMSDHVGERIGILGYGSIGRQVARVASAMGMDVLAYTATARTTPESRQDRAPQVPGTGDPDGTIPSAWYSGTSAPDLHTFLAQKLDYLLISVPLTPATHGLISDTELDVLARNPNGGTFVLNISRGPTVDTPALLHALNSERIRGAAVDVTDPEPLPADHPLWDAKNVIITPHLAGSSGAYMDRCLGLVFKGNLERYRESGGTGEGMWNVVDRKRGY